MRPLTAPLIGAIEAGGTKLVCGAGRSVEELRRPANRCVVPTGTDPEAAWAQVRRFFASWPVLDALGVGSFGPLDLEAGVIAGTPKPGWQGFSWRGRAAELTGGPLALDSDVDAAALAEWRHGAARGTAVAAYLTVGTGIGCGAVVDGRVLRGRRHPEMGHLLVPRRPGDAFAGSCRHHDDCLEGLASGEALRRRAGVPAEDLPDEHPVWALEADYLGLGVACALLALAPDRLVLGGGVLRRRGLLEAVRRRALAHLNGYLDLGEDPTGALLALLVAPGLGEDAGLVGAFVQAADLLAAAPRRRRAAPPR